MYRGRGIFAICDTETEYAFRFMEYLSHRNNIMFEIRVFTSAEHLLKFAEEHSIEILLISERSMCDEVAGLDVGKLIILKEGGSNQMYPDCASVYKYQPSDLVVREIMESYGNDERVRQPASVKNRALQVYGIYSPMPYTQKMLLSFALGMELAKTRKVLYINLDTFSGFEEFTNRKHEYTLSDLIYLFRRRDKGFAIKMNGMVYSVGSLDYLPPIRTPSDYMEISGEEWIRFFEMISQSSQYDTLILDIGSSIPDVMLLLAYCSRIYLPVLPDALSNARKAEFETLLHDTDNGVISEKLQTITPPEIICTGSGQSILEGLPWSGLGRYAASLCAGAGV